MRANAFLRLGFFVVTSSIAPLALASGPAEASPDVEELTTFHAKELYQQANVLYLQEKYALAYALYKAAWALRPNYKIAANLGSCEYELGKYRDAAEHLAFSLRGQPANTPLEERRYFAERQANAVKRVATLNIEVTNAGAADVFIDDKLVGNAPLTDAVYVEPGVHFIHGRNKIASGHERIDVKQGESRTVSLTLLPPPTPTPPAPEAAPASSVLLGIGSGLTAGLVTGGGVNAFVQYSHRRYAQPTTPLTSKDFVIAWGGLIAGGVLGVVTAVGGIATTRIAPQRVAVNVNPQQGNWQVRLAVAF